MAEYLKHMKKHLQESMGLSENETCEDEEELDEANATGAVAGYNTPNAFSNADEDTIETLGYKRANNTKKNTKAESTFVKMSKEMFINELNYQDYKNNEEFTQKQKLNKAINEVNKMLFQIERIVGQNVKLKEEVGLTNNDYWKSSQSKFYKIGRRMVEVAKKLKELGS